MHPTLWSSLFQLETAGIVEKILRPVLVYAFLVVGLRLAGKRELAQLNPFDLVVLLTLSNTVQNAIIGNDNSVTGGVLGATTLLVVNYLVVRFLYHHESIERVVEGAPEYLVRDGHLQARQMDQELVSREELEAAARRQGLSSLDEVQDAVLEPGGALVFTARKPEPDVTRHRELMDRLAELSAQVADLRERVGRTS
jgi:uncharacterized membrane protein YcaP (DUF421 family)